MPRTVASSKPPTSPMAGSSAGAGASTAAQANAAIKEEIATLAPNDDDVNGAANERYQSIETLLMTRAWKTRPRPAINWPRRSALLGSRSANADQPISASAERTMKDGTFR